MDIETLIKEFNFKTAKSSGPGGQHVNKTSSKVFASFHIQNSKGLNDDEKELLSTKLFKKISSGSKSFTVFTGLKVFNGTSTKTEFQ